MHPLTTCKTSDTITILETLFNKLEYGGPHTGVNRDRYF